MSLLSVALEAGPGVCALLDVCLRPERVFRYQIVEGYCPMYMERSAAQRAAIPGKVEQEVKEYCKCSRLEGGSLCGLAIAAMRSIWWPPAADAAGMR